MKDSEIFQSLQVFPLPPHAKEEEPGTAPAALRTVDILSPPTSPAL